MCWVLGSLGSAALDYRIQKLAARPWLADWPWRLAMYLALGGLVAIIGYAPIFLYGFVQAVIGFYNHPPTAKMLLALVPLAVASIVAVLALRKVAWMAGGYRSQLNRVWRIVAGLSLLAVASAALGAGVLGNLYLLQDH